jgi:cysteine-rich repeat protein
MKKNSRGLSTVVATLLIILVTLVAVGIIWVVVKNVIQKNADQISFGKFTVDLKISHAHIINETDISVTVMRNPGKGELSGILFIAYGRDNSEITKYNISMKELEERNFQVILYVINTSIVEKVSIAPIFISDLGKEFIGDVQDEYIFSHNSETSGSTPLCGNGMREGSEGCDDNNTVSGDGCSSTCTIESGYTCNTAIPNVCTHLSGTGDNYIWTDELVMNGGFEFGNLNSWTTPSGAYFLAGDHPDGITYVSPQAGAYAVYYDGASSIDHSIQQDVDLIAYAGYINSGNAVINATGWGVSSEYPNHDLTRIQIIFLDQSKNIISTALDTGYVSNGVWWKAEVLKSIPEGTHYVRIWGNSYENCINCKSGSIDSFSLKVGYEE